MKRENILDYERRKMSRLEILKQEREQISQMSCLSFDLMEKCREWYDNEIEAIEKYNAPNPEMREKGEEE